MWLEVKFPSFEVRQQGFTVLPRDTGALFRSPGLETLDRIGDLREAEYGQAIEVNRLARSVSFGRDYLGHHPLLYAHTAEGLFVTDEVNEVVAWLARRSVALRLSEEALALYFAIGYVPQGMTLYKEITACENASLYHWKNGNVVKDSLFKPLTPDRRFPLEALRERVELEVEGLARSGRPIDVWCSGGLDSSIMAVCCNDKGRSAGLLTLAYSQEVRAQFGDGEYRFAADVARHCGASLRTVSLSEKLYREVYALFAAGHIGPVIDIVVPPKYALASATRDIAVTGEGGDPMFSGVKNNMILFVHARHPDVPLGRLYALAHQRLVKDLGRLLRRGPELESYVTDYLEQRLAGYPGTLVRKLFYANTFMKQGGLIFPKNYYAGKRYGATVRHPLASRALYEAAFRLADERKYRYPRGKLALLDLYGERLPRSVVKRRKSGVRLPLEAYMRYISAGGALEPLLDSGFFVEDVLVGSARGAGSGYDDVLRRYALVTLGRWISQNGGPSDDRKLPDQSGDHEQALTRAQVQ